MQRAAFAAVITTATALAVACGSFGEGGGSAPPSSDASDATSSADSAVPPDGTADVDAGCATVVHERFEAKWTLPWEEEMSGGGTLTRAADGGYEGGALIAQVNAVDGGAAAQLERDVPGPVPKSASLSFAMRVSQSNDGYFELGCTLQLHGQNHLSYLMFVPELLNGELALDENARLDGVGVDTGPSAKVGPVVATKWYSIRLELHDIGLTTANAVGYVDDVETLRRTFTFPEPPATLRIKCGIDHGDPGSVGTVLVDDARLDVCH